MKVKVAINGFGRIGRTVARILSKDPSVEVVAINDIHEANVLAHYLKYDSTHGKFNDQLYLENDQLTFGVQKSKVFKEPDPSNLPWTSLGVDFVLECTGSNKTITKSLKHIDAGAKRVILSAPPMDRSVPTVVLGVNDHLLNKSELIVSNASCTTNNAAPMIQLLDELCEIDSCYITTVHSYTGDQKIQDTPHSDWRRGRGAAQSIVPTTTGAAKALTLIFPELSDVIGGCGIRVPVPDGSLTDITCIVKNPKSVSEINKAFRDASLNRYRGILEYTEDPIVSADVLGNSHSCLFDSLLTSVINHMVKVVGWYDNEVGYSHRMIDLLKRLS